MMNEITLTLNSCPDVLVALAQKSTVIDCCVPPSVLKTLDQSTGYRRRQRRHRLVYGYSDCKIHHPRPNSKIHAIEPRDSDVPIRPKCPIFR